ncbi:hypothetical protein T4E_11077, partial [Trichinella pseudospiralis]
LWTVWLGAWRRWKRRRIGPPACDRRGGRRSASSAVVWVNSEETARSFGPEPGQRVP